MTTEGWIALAAAIGAYGHIGWAIYAARRGERSDVRVAVRHEPIAVASLSYVLTVVVTNHGPATEHVEGVGLRFNDATGIFPADWSMGEQGTWQDIDIDLAPRANYRWSYDFGAVRFRHGLGYRPWALLGTGDIVEGAASVADDYGLKVAGLDAWTDPLPPRDGDDHPPAAS